MSEPREDETLVDITLELAPHHPDLPDLRDLILAGYSREQVYSLKGLDGDLTVAELMAEGPEHEPHAWPS